MENCELQKKLQRTETLHEVAGMLLDMHDDARCQWSQALRRKDSQAALEHYTMSEAYYRAMDRTARMMKRGGLA
jgi:hypothetical protein